MVNPVSCGIPHEGEEVTCSISVDDFIIELEEDTETGMCKYGVRMFGENVIV